MAHNVLILGASRGLGASLLAEYAAQGFHAFGTTRSAKEPSEAPKNTTYIPSIDISQQSAGSTLASSLSKHLGNDKKKKLDVAIISAGYFELESFDEPNWDAQMKMYTTSAIGPVFLVQALAKAGLLTEGSKVILISSESGSLTLRDDSEGGGNYAHHASKTAENMVGKLLSIDLKPKGVVVGMLHPGFMRTEMTKNVGFDKFWDDAGAKTPDQAAEMLIDFIDKFDMSRTGEFWAPGGQCDIGTADKVLGPAKDPHAPLRLPW